MVSSNLTKALHFCYSGLTVNKQNKSLHLYYIIKSDVECKLHAHFKLLLFTVNPTNAIV